MAAPSALTTLELAQRLIGFDTTNPPGNEAACIDWIRGLLSEAGIESELHEKEPGRPNLVARLRGETPEPGLLLYGHVDVVTARDQQWRRPPFEAEIADGFLWGRGALDMKGGVAMLVQAFLRARELELKHDVVLAVVSDEEAGGVVGEHYVVLQLQVARARGVRRLLAPNRRAALLSDPGRGEADLHAA